MSLDDAYTYAGSGGVLRNHLDIRDADRLDEVMNELASVAWAAAAARGSERLDFAELARFHRLMFADLFGWAGELRDVNATATGTGIVYARPEFIRGALDDLFAILSRENYLADIDDPRRFADLLAERWGYLTQIHPFRDGNTRSQSLWVSELARRAGPRSSGRGSTSTSSATAASQQSAAASSRWPTTCSP